MVIALYLQASYSMPLSLMEGRNYSISLCEHGEFVCHQRSVGCSELFPGRDKIEKIVGCKTIDYLVEDDEFMFISSVLE